MPPRHNGTITLLGLLTALTPLSVDMYLPALPSLVQEFSAKEGHVQLSLASFFLGLAIGQAFYGPISDRFGRKLPLYAGLVLFVLASAGCAVTTSSTSSSCCDSCRRLVSAPARSSRAPLYATCLRRMKPYESFRCSCS